VHLLIIKTKSLLLAESVHLILQNLEVKI